MENDQRMLTLDVIGVGLSVEMFRQGDVWHELKQAESFSANVMPAQDSPRWRHANGAGVLSKRRADTLELALKNMVEAWPIPSVRVLATDANDWLRNTYSDEELREMDSMYLDRTRMPAGLHWTQIMQSDVIYSDTPEDVIEAIFRTFERHPDMPALLVYAFGPDGKYDAPRTASTPLASYAAMVVARRERVEWLRPWAPYTEVNVDEWWTQFNGWQETPPKPFKPTPFFPTPWTRAHFKQWDALPTLARLHRPVVTRLTDEQGTPLKRQAQHEALVEGWKQAAGETYIDSVFFDTGKAGTGIATLSPVLRELKGSPDLLDPKEGIDLFARLGETGAASPFVQLVLATMAAAESKRASMVVPMRRPGQVTMIQVSPSDDEIPSYLFKARLLPQTSQAPGVPVRDAVPATQVKPVHIDPQRIAADRKALDDLLASGDGGLEGL
ncbi:type VI lipase adapter Tla3 domain-containing protein [Stenotrophomonas maltophilia]|uniref:type VI lipase adapter Tla3 domain-containing protein n=1 Tax=Stenotrophomonas maltophilia TaxID=40324 RepID=UPI0015F6B7AD|nr:DUF2875 family protein [Stenotrophomonas maltophilia]